MTELFRDEIGESMGEYWKDRCKTPNGNLQLPYWYINVSGGLIDVYIYIDIGSES